MSIQLQKSIFKAFGSVSFPSHLGLHAAKAMDDWIEDKEILKQITKENDYEGEWWDVPKEDLHSCMKDLDYLDAHGFEFYLPAYMTGIISDPIAFDEPKKRSSSWQIIFSLLSPHNADTTKEDIKYFENKLSRINGSKKAVVRDFLVFIERSKEYNDHARSLATEALQQDYWSL